MRKWLALLGMLAYGLVACPADPTFVASDLADATTEDAATEVTGSEAIATETADEVDVALDADTADPDVVDGGTETVTTDVAPVETSSCPPACGPLASCIEGACRCPDGVCDGVITDLPIEELALVMPAADAPAIVFSEFAELAEVRLARWAGDDWSIGGSFERDGAVALDATIDMQGRVVALATAESGDAEFAWNSAADDWDLTRTFQSPCGHGAIDYDESADLAAIACTSSSSATLLLSLLQTPTGEVANRPPLSLGTAPNPNLVRFRVDPTGRPWVAYSEPTTGAAALVVARFEGSTWIDEPVESVKLPTGSPLGPPMALGLDGLGRPHLVYVAWVEGDLVLVHRVRQGVDAWARYAVATTIPVDGATVLDLEPGEGASVHVLITGGRRLEWLALEAGEVIRGATLEASTDVVDADLVTDGEREPWVAYAPGRTGARLWRPAGP